MSLRLELLISPSVVDDIRTPRVSHNTAPGLDITASSRRICVRRSSRLWMSSAYRRGRRMRWRFNCISSCASSWISGHASLSRSNTFTATCSFVARGTADSVMVPRPRGKMRARPVRGKVGLRPLAVRRRLRPCAGWTRPIRRALHSARVSRVPHAAVEGSRPVVRTAHAGMTRRSPRRQLRPRTLRCRFFFRRAIFFRVPVRRSGSVPGCIPRFQAPYD